MVDGVCEDDEKPAWCPWDCHGTSCNFDGSVDVDEECDDGNHDALDGCDNCLVEHCGNGVLEAQWGEECDPVTLEDMVWCSNCTAIPQVACLGLGTTCDQVAAVAVACLKAPDWDTLAACLVNVPVPVPVCDAMLWGIFLDRIALCQDQSAKCWADVHSWPEWAACWSCGEC